MAISKVKPEMKGDTSRWTRRADAKDSANKIRRETDKDAVEEGTADAPRMRRVRCQLCKALVYRETAHRHQGAYIGDECWDERLKASE